MNIYSTPLAVERKQIKFPKSKKHRIRIKWSKREENYTYVPRIYKLGDRLICHPSIYQKLKEDPIIKNVNMSYGDYLA